MPGLPVLSPANLASPARPRSRGRANARAVGYWPRWGWEAPGTSCGPPGPRVIDRLGYPTYFLVILGVWKLLGAVALLVPRAPRLKGKADPGTLVFLLAPTGLTAASWALRPRARRDLASPARGQGVRMVRGGRP